MGITVTTLVENTVPQGAKIDQIVRALQAMELQKIVVGHCTGFRAIMALAQAFGEKFQLNSVGQVLRF